MTTALCVRCERPTPDGAACVTCGIARPTRQLTELADMVPAARDVAMGLARYSRHGATAGKPGSAIPLDLSATQRLDAVYACLSTWARHICETRGVALP